MNMKRYFFFLTFYFLLFYAKAQTQFYSTVKIEFEKTTALQALYKEIADDASWFENVKDQIPKTSISYFDFIADSAHSVYKPGREVPTNTRTWFRPMANENKGYTDYQKNTSISQKPIYEETFLIEDSLLKIKWKITADTRNIAGFEC